ncbi:MAG: glycosyltransferase family 4 protein [Flavobacteriales bacterium]|nr:glycosyltransferase family 4 protein [Flavobacteriales bacterium]MCB9194084.1 glycosyltransferase family 4 protein [Flavobacteriales bacterium]
MSRILFIASHRPGRAPGQRFRFEQYFSHLERNGFQCELSYLVSPEDDSVLYQRGHHLEKARFVRRSHAVRANDVKRMNAFDIIFIFREALMTRSTRYEQAFRTSRAKLVFDFDDAIWLPNVSAANRRWAWLKGAGKTAGLIRMADLVFAGNAYLAAYASRSNAHVEIVPTTIDTEEYLPVPKKEQGPVVIGWSGSLTTIQHFQYAIPALRVLKERFGDRIAIRVVGDGGYREPDLGVQGLPWRKETELKDLGAMDIGIMPLPDDDWARGKCGLKGLQYMALGIPAVMSPVGVNTEIIADGVNGFLAGPIEDWVEKMGRLIGDAELRLRLGTAARDTVERRYSVHAWRDRYVQLFNEILERRS